MVDEIFGNSFGEIKELAEFDILLCCIPRETKLKIRQMIQDLVKNKIKEVSRTQFIEIPANCLKGGDIIFDLKKKYIQRIQYVSPYDATHSGKSDNTICICYGDDYDCDNVGINSEVTILIDTADYVDRKCMNDNKNNESHEFNEEMEMEE